MSYEFSRAPTSRCDGGMLHARADHTPGTPDFSGPQRNGNQFGLRSEFRPLRQTGICFKRIKEASTFDIAGDAGSGCVLPSALTKTALARKLKHPKGLNRHSTFRVGAEQETLNDRLSNTIGSFDWGALPHNCRGLLAIHEHCSRPQMAVYFGSFEENSGPAGVPPETQDASAPAVIREQEQCR